MNVSTGHRVVIEFLSAEGYSPIEVHRGLRSVYGEDVTDVSAVRPLVHCLRAVKMTFGTGPTADEQSRQRRRRPKKR